MDTKQQEAWDDLKNIWNKSSQGKEINIIMSELIIELKSKTTEFERNSIKKDVEFIKGNISQFEKDSIKRDMEFIKGSIGNFEKNFVKRGLNILKRFVERIKRNKN
ncbi:hypothetical protein [Tenacibaculum aiptasiae]|uniref:hypothetical protein n=1 Tax=Tenacibaculum aiptasiae TaxID=426481 RepID=UPI003B5C045D